jgi:iron complex transport system permease protein
MSNPSGAGGNGRGFWGEIAVLTGAGILTAIYFHLQRWNLNALLAGEDAAKGLGVEVEKADG